MQVSAFVTWLFFDILAQTKTALEAEFGLVSNYESRFGSFNCFYGLFCFFQSDSKGDLA